MKKLLALTLLISTLTKAQVYDKVVTSVKYDSAFSVTYLVPDSVQKTASAYKDTLICYTTTSHNWWGDTEQDVKEKAYRIYLNRNIDAIRARYRKYSKLHSEMQHK